MAVKFQSKYKVEGIQFNSLKTILSKEKQYHPNSHINYDNHTTKNKTSKLSKEKQLYPIWFDITLKGVHTL